MTWDEINKMALEWDRGVLNAAELAMDPDEWDNSAFYIERAYQFAMVANALHRIKDNPPPDAPDLKMVA